MGLLAIRKKLRDQLAARTDIDDMFSKVIEDSQPMPVNTDCIVIRKHKVSEYREEFGEGLNKTIKFEVLIDCIMMRRDEEEGDEAQLRADQIVREGICSDPTLGCLVDDCSPTYTEWGQEQKASNRYHTIVHCEIHAFLNPTNR